MSKTENLQPKEDPETQPCPVCNGRDEDCPICDGTGEVENIPDPDYFDECKADDERYDVPQNLK